jgi:hypothetical protein
MYDVNINMTFRTKTHERAQFIVKQIYRARKQITKLSITEKNNIGSSITPVKKVGK